MLARTTMASPVGTLTLVASDAGLRAVLWEVERPGRVRLPADVADAAHPVLEATSAQLREYFAGRRTTFDLPLDLHGTAFQVEVWRALGDIAYGRTETYADVARRAGGVEKTRAVAAAIARNPVSIVLACHRVVGRDGSLTGFAGGLPAKRTLLDLEADQARRVGVGGAA